MKKETKRNISWVLALVMLLSICPIQAFAAGNMVFKADSVTAIMGSQVDIRISCENNPGVSGVQLSVDYDDTILTLESVEYTSADITGLTSQAPARLSSPVKLTWYNGTVDTTYNGVLATLHFTVNALAPEGSEAAVRLDADEDNICNAAEQNVAFDLVDGAVLAVSYIPGDINNDRKVNIKDVIRMAQYLADWDVEVVEACLDTNGDGKVNIKDLIRLSQFLADWDVDLFPKPTACTHRTLNEVEAKAATCVSTGNDAYWVCSGCGELFADSAAAAKTTLAAVTRPIDPNNHSNLIIDAAVPATQTATGLTEGSHCAYEGGKGCGTVILAQTVIPIPVKPHTITYNLAFGQPYLSQKMDILRERNKNNPTAYNEGDEFMIHDLTADDLGFTFDGWYTASGTRVDHISATDKQNFILYAHWREETYNIQYNVFKTPVAEITDPVKLSYTVSKGLYALPNPDIYNYLFLGWYDNEGNEVTSIPAGSTGDRVLNAYFASKRNYAKASFDPQPLVVEDMDDGVIYYAYELGTISNVPVSDPIWVIQTVSGLGQKKSQTESTTITASVSRTMSDTVAYAAQNSQTWALSSDWSDVVEANEAWCIRNDVEQDEAKENATTESGTISITDSYGGSRTVTENDGTTTLKYDSKNENHGNSTTWDVNSKSSREESGEEYAELSAEISAPIGKAGGKAGVKSSVKVGSEDSRGFELTSDNSSNSHTGSDTTTIDTTTTANSSTWNSSSTESQTKTDSERTIVSLALSRSIEEKLGYTHRRIIDGGVDNTQGIVTTDSTTVNSSNTVTFSESSTSTTTSEYTSDGKSEGWYRCVTATDVHVFGVVGYDIGARSYFTYTYSVADGKTYDFLDYSPDGTFKDPQITVLPFTIPRDIYDYVKYMTVDTAGLDYEYNNANHTAVVDSYTGTSKQVSVPSYTVDANGIAYRVVGMNPGAFANEKGNQIEAIYLSDFITAIPDNAFNGCTNLTRMMIPAKITSVGTDAFKNCPAVCATASNAEVAEGIAACGARNIELNISAVPGDAAMNLTVAGGDNFSLDGGEKTFTNLTLESHAETTGLNNIYFSELKKPIKIYSPNVNLYKTEILNSSDLCMVLAADNTALAVSGTNTMSSKRANALLSKAMTVSYTNSGKLKLYGNLLTSGGVIDPNSRITFAGTDQTIVPIDNFESYLDMITVSYDVNGGDTLVLTEDQCFRNRRIGDILEALPTPGRENHDFGGWFTAAEGGERVSLESVFGADTKLYAHWIPHTFNLFFNANGGSCAEELRKPMLFENIGMLPTPTRPGYSFDGWYTGATGGSEVNSSSVFETGEDVTVYAHWTIQTYSVSWNQVSGATVTVTRTDSPYAQAPTGVVPNGGAIYYGDVLSIAYSPSAGYRITSFGSTSVTVSGNVGSDTIYVSAAGNEYAYNVVCQSTNGNLIASYQEKAEFGRTRTITPSNYPGYDTPAAQTVTWDSTSPKTITFAYRPTAVATEQNGASGKWLGRSWYTWKTWVQYSNRTATTVDIRIRCVETIAADYGYGYNTYFTPTINGNKYSEYMLSSGSASSASGKERNLESYSPWYTVTVGNANPATISISVKYRDNNGNESDTGTWSSTVSIPAY